MPLLSTILFALAVSLDGFGVGFAYGMRNIIIPYKSLLVICLTSSTAIAFSMMSGKMLTLFIPIETAELIGAVILIVMGLYMLIHAWVGRKNNHSSLPEAEEILLNFRISPLGIVVQILKEPSKADLDQSGEINIKEAFILGFALAMDALGAGFAVAVAGFPPLLTALCVGVSKFILVSVAVKLGKISSNNWLGKKTLYIPGLVLFLLGFWKI